MTNKRILSGDEKRTGIICNDCDMNATCEDGVGDYLCEECFSHRYDPIDE